MTQKKAAPARPPAIVLLNPAGPRLVTTGAEPCAQTDPDEWFPQHGHNPTAQRLCATCPLYRECQEWALANPELASDGIWGGLTRKQREALQRRNARKAA
jgi:WhiB family redox-sensing transcriptional regulator